MKYRLVKLSGNFKSFSSKELDWFVNFEEVEGDREDENTVPNANGWYYFDPQKLTNYEAFMILKGCIIERHEDQIEKLTDSLNKLKRLSIS